MALRKPLWTAIGATLLLGAALIGCAPRSQTAAPPGGCDVAVQNVVAFTESEAVDIIEGRAFGEDCRRAVLTLAVRNKDGEALWAFAAPYTAFGYEIDRAVEIPRAQVEDRLASWVQVIIDDTGELPPWAPEAPDLDAANPGRHATPLPREAYGAVRASKLPRLCYGASVNEIECIAYDPQTRIAAAIYRSGS